MEEGHYTRLSDLLAQLQITSLDEIDFHQTDTERTLAKVRLLSAAATYFNTLAVIEFGGRPGPQREEGLVEQVVAAAFQTYQGEEIHPEPFEKAAVLMRGITQGHPFEDANKRTGFLLVVYYLEHMGYPLPVDLPEDEVVDLSVRISAGGLRDVHAIAEELRRLWSVAGDEQEG
jgi:death-on-curing protein